MISGNRSEEVPWGARTQPQMSNFGVSVGVGDGDRVKMNMNTAPSAGAASPVDFFLRQPVLVESTLMMTRNSEGQAVQWGTNHSLMPAVKTFSVPVSTATTPSARETSTFVHLQNPVQQPVGGMSVTKAADKGRSTTSDSLPKNLISQAPPSCSTLQHISGKFLIGDVDYI